MYDTDSESEDEYFSAESSDEDFGEDEDFEDESDNDSVALEDHDDVWNDVRAARDNRRRPADFSGNSGVNQDFQLPDNSDTDATCFCDKFFTDELLSHLCDWTNARAWKEFEQLQDESHHINIQDIKEKS
jgi:hypothetical protein